MRAAAFKNAVAALKARGKTVTCVESTCGGLINAGIMAVDGSSAGDGSREYIPFPRYGKGGINGCYVHVKVA
jgi:hypothetical protein